MNKKGRNPPKREPIIKNRIRYCRTAISLSQKDLAFLMELRVQQISRWEKGNRRPNLYSAIGLAVATQRLVDDLFLDYRREWQERIRKRVELLNSKVEKVLTEPKIQKNDRHAR